MSLGTYIYVLITDKPNISIFGFYLLPCNKYYFMKLVIQIAAGIIVAWSIITIITAMVKTIADNRKLKQ